MFIYWKESRIIELHSHQVNFEFPPKKAMKIKCSIQFLYFNSNFKKCAVTFFKQSVDWKDEENELMLFKVNDFKYILKSLKNKLRKFAQ